MMFYPDKPMISVRPRRFLYFVTHWLPRCPNWASWWAKMAIFGDILETQWDRDLKLCSTPPKPIISNRIKRLLHAVVGMQAEIWSIQVCGPCPKRAWPKNGFPLRKFWKLFFGICSTYKLSDSTIKPTFRIISHPCSDTLNVALTMVLIWKIQLFNVYIKLSQLF